MKNLKQVANLLLFAVVTSIIAVATQNSLGDGTDYWIYTVGGISITYYVYHKFFDQKA